MKKTPTDPIIAELRAVRKAHAARFDYNIAAIFQDIRAMEAASDRKHVRYPARRITAAETPAPRPSTPDPFAHS